MTTMKKVSTGDPLVIPANTYNAFIDAAADYQQRIKPRQKLEHAMQSASGTFRGPGPGGVVWVRNDSPMDCWRYFILGIEDSVYEPQTIMDTDGSFLDHVVFSAVFPVAQTHVAWDKHVILLEPILAGKVGRAMIHGICQVRLIIEDETHQFAKAPVDFPAFMMSSATGSTQILWRQPDVPIGEPCWAIVKLGVPSVPSATMMPCKVWQDGGTTDGDKTTQCDRTYLVKTIEAFDELEGGSILGEELEPLKQRPAAGKLVTAPTTGDGIIGTGFYVTDPYSGMMQFVLYDANETLAVEVCDDGN
jgi:hypothetical protein